MRCHPTLPVLFLIACQSTQPSNEALAVTPCPTAEHLGELLAIPTPPPSDRKGDEPLMLRDSFGTFDVRTSEHFALKWGPNAVITPEQADAMLAIFEAVRQREVIEMAHPAPTGSDRYFYNVYVANSGGSAPTIAFNGGYSYIDVEGFPFFVMHPSYVTTAQQDAKALVAHEYYHSIQFAAHAYTYDDQAWYWESTAVWIAEQISPHSIASYQMGAYTQLPELSLDHYEYAGDGSLVESHHYAAGLFEQHLTEHVADWKLIRDSWTTSTATDQPLDKLEALLAPHQTSVQEAFAVFAAHNVAWDYANGKDYRIGEKQYASRYASEAHADAIKLDLATLGPAGDFVDAPADRLPQSLGYNVVRLVNATGGPAVVEVRRTDAGDHGTPSAMSATLVRGFADRVEYSTIPFDGATAHLEVPALGGETSLAIVVAAIPAARVADERFPYAARVFAPSVEVTDPMAESHGCDLAAHAPTSPPWAILAIVALACVSLRCGRRVHGATRTRN